MKTKTQKIKLVNGNQSFPTLSISQQTAEAIAIFVLTYGIGN